MDLVNILEWTRDLSFGMEIGLGLSLVFATYLEYTGRTNIQENLYEGLRESLKVASGYEII